MSSQINKSWLNHELHTSGGGQSPSGKRWRESLAGWILAGLASRWSLKHAGKGVLALLLVLMGWGVVMPVQAKTIFSEAGPWQGAMSGPVSYLQYPDNDALDLVNTDYTLSACIILNRFNQDFISGIMVKRTTDKGWAFGIAGKRAAGITTGEVRLKLMGYNNTATLFSGKTISLGQKYHVAVVYENDLRSVKIFIDGEIAASSSDFPSPKPSGKPLRVGHETSGYIMDDLSAHDAWRGTLSQLQIDDTALKADEIKKLDAECRDLNFPPYINSLSVSPESGVAPLNVTLSAEVEDPNGDPFTVEYSVDGQPLASNTANTATLTEGYHVIQAIAKDSKGEASYPIYYSIKIDPNRPPNIKSLSVSPEKNIIAGSLVTLNATVVDPESDPFTVEYSVNGQKLSGNTVTLTESGSHTVMVTATDSKGNTSPPFLKTVVVKAANKLPVADFTPPPSGKEAPQTFTFNTQGSYDPDGSIANYEWTINGQILSGKTLSFTFDQAGDYQVKLTVTDNEGATGSMTQTVTVLPRNDPPVACIKPLNPTSEMAPLTTTIDGSCSIDDGTIVNYLWSIARQTELFNDDGSFKGYEWSPVPNQVTGNSTSAPTVEFKEGGTYKIELTVKDDKGKPSITPAVENLVLNKTSFTLEPTGCTYKSGIPCDLTNLQPGQDFDITFKVSKTVLEYPVDGVSAYVGFDPTKLQVREIKNAGILDYVLTSKFDNAKGFINFAAMSYANDAPTKDTYPDGFPLVTVGFTPLAETPDQPTLLTFDPSKTKVSYLGETRKLEYAPIPISIGQKTNTQSGKVTWKGRATPPPGNDKLTIYRVDNSGNSVLLDQVTADGSGNFTFSQIPPDTKYLCVKSQNTLATKIIPGTGVISGELWQGDSSGDGQIGIEDFKKPLSITTGVGVLPDCNPTSGKQYVELADLDGNGCVDSNPTNYPDGDLSLFSQSNTLFQDEQGKLPDERITLCISKDGGKTFRKGQRSNENGQITFQTTPIPMGLPVGSTFEVQVLVNADATHSVDGAAVSLNYDPEGLKVVSLTAGTQLDFVLERKFDNTQGSLDFAAMLWANDYPTDKFTLVIIQFTLMGEGGEHSLSFAPQQTIAALGGEYVNAPVQDDWMTFVDKRPIYTISNYLFDAAGQPQAGVTIQIGDQTAVTNDQGFWKITGLAAGEYTVKASKDGYDFSEAPCAISRDQMDCQSVQPKSKLTVDIDSDWLVAEGRELTYLITVTNTSTQPVTGLTVTDTLPLGAWLLSLESLQGGTCDTSTVTCRDLQLAAGASATLKLVIGNAEGETLKNSVMVTANEQPAVSADKWTKVKPEFSVFINDTPDPVDMLQSLTYEFMVELTEAATTDATGVKLEILLPTGVTVTAWNIADGQMEGNCDTSAFPKVVCTLPDLSPSGLRQVPVTVTVKLADAGLLLFTAEATLSANEYPSDWERERTKIHVPPDILVDLAILLDTTVSMQGEIDGLKAALEKFLQTNVDPTLAPLMALITFKDDVTVKAFTRDLNLLLKVLKSLKAEGGGACPEASVEALEMAAPHVKPGGQIWLGTDASPYADSVERIPNLLELLLGQQIRFHATVTGDCATAGSANDETWEGVGNP